MTENYENRGSFCSEKYLPVKYTPFMSLQNLTTCEIKVNNKNNRARSLSGVFIINLESIISYCFDVSIIDFEQVNAGWVKNQVSN